MATNYYITRNSATRDYTVRINGEYIGTRRTQYEAETLLNEELTRLAELESRAVVAVETETIEAQASTYDIDYNRETTDFDCTIDGQYVGSRPTYWLGLELVDEEFTRLTELESRAVAVAEPETELTAEEEANNYLKQRNREARATIEQQLAAQGLRKAYSDEAGWYVNVEVQGTYVKVWATDEPDTVEEPAPQYCQYCDQPATITHRDVCYCERHYQMIEVSTDMAQAAQMAAMTDDGDVIAAIHTYSVTGDVSALKTELRKLVAANTLVDTAARYCTYLRNVHGVVRLHSFIVRNWMALAEQEPWEETEVKYPTTGNFDEPDDEPEPLTEEEITIIVEHLRKQQSEPDDEPNDEDLPF